MNEILELIPEHVGWKGILPPLIRFFVRERVRHELSLGWLVWLTLPCY